MNPSEHHWLAAVLIAWASVFLVVLGAMLRSIVGDREIARAGPPACRASTLGEAAWAVAAIGIVMLTMLLTVR